MKISHATTILILLFCQIAVGQIYYGIHNEFPSPTAPKAYSTLYKIDVNGSSCDETKIGFVLDADNLNDTVWVGGNCLCPDNYIYAHLYQDSTHIFKIDPQTALIIDTILLSDTLNYYGTFSCGLNNKIRINFGYPAIVYKEIDPATGIVTELGMNTSIDTNYWGKLVMYDNIGYEFSYGGLYKIDFGTDPLEKELLYLPSSQHFFGGVSAYPSICNTFISVDWNNSSSLYLINIDQHTSTPLCQIPYYVQSLSGVDEFNPVPSCPVPIYLDRDNSSGAIGGDYNSAIFNCKTNNVKIADDDAFIPAYPFIESMTISIGGVLDPGKEGLYMGLPPTGIVVSGNTTTTITFTKANSSVNDSLFVEALKLIQYKDIALSPTGGIREVAVSIAIQEGFPIDTAFCHVQVQQLPSINVDLGPDTYFCQGSSVTINAGNPGLTYYWSGGQTTQTINAMFQGTYKVTVSDGINCPGSDEIYVKKLPVINATITGPTYACAGDSVALVLNCNCTGSFDITFGNNLAQADTFFNVTDGISFNVFLPVNPNGTLYDLNYHFEQVNMGVSNSCLHFPPQTITILVNPLVTMVYQDAFICQGDSMNIGGVWQSQPGIYTNYETNIFGCDVAINTTLYVTMPGNQSIYLNQTTCEPSLAGIFTQSLSNINGCDSTVITTVTLVAGDTVFVSSQSCDPTMTGVFTQSLTNQNGCDSTVITTVTLVAGDTVFIASQSCDPALAGVFTQSLNNINGCDSTVITTVTLVAGDTVFIASQSCNPALAGVFTQSLSNINGCDSTVITTVTLVAGDTVFVASQSCDPALAGVFTQSLSNINGCDSTVITTVALVAGDTVFLASQSCDPALAGVFTQNLNNINGCDSMVITTVTLVAGDTVFVASQSCDPVMAGVFTQNLTNQNGCDSMVITTVSLISNDMVMLNVYTCDPTSVGTSMVFLINQFGCDSVVVTTNILAPSDTIFLASQTCDPALAGISTANFTNQYGCDSVVVTTLTLLELDTTLLAGFTCEPSETGLFELHFTGQNGCDSLVLMTVSLLPNDSCETAPTLPSVYGPNAFSPNGDGVNDLFLLFGNDQVEKILSLQVYSRWGELVFESFNQLPNDPNGGWDGSFRGKPMDVGVFLFYSEVMYKNGKVEIVKGDVNLLK